MTNLPLLPQQAATELLIRRKARGSILDYARAIDIPGKPATEDPDAEVFRPIESAIALHHRLLLSALETVSTTPHGRLMVLMPPGSAKSTYASVVFPSWYLGRDRDRRVILASYGDDLARKMGRRVRSIGRQSRYQQIWNTSLQPESRAAQDFALTNGSEYMACGILSGVTGNRAHGLIIDDPIKGREQANSGLIREKTWDAYEDDLKTRLIPGGWIVLIQCMTGDTPVMLADGTERPLSEIRPGDHVATYKNGRLITSTVTNWASNGLDSVYAIKTTSGKIVRANGRHPFLVSDTGVLKWVKTKDLLLGQEILRVNGVSGKAKPAHGKDANSRLSAGDIASPTTTKSDGLTALGHRLSTKILGVLRTSSIATESQWPITSACSPNRAASARSVNSRPETTYAPTGAANCASIIATIAKKFARFFAMTATLSWGMQRLLKSLWRQPNISDFTPDAIVEITPAGIEEVFDVQVTDTENFIANGLVSHNTRWHEDDLAGRILPEGWKGESGELLCRDGNIWNVLCVQARCEIGGDPLDRRRGEYLWPEWFDRKHWAQFESNPRTWASLYQQIPAPLEGGFFKPDKIEVIDALPAMQIQWVRAYDLASLQGDGDYSAGAKLGRLLDGRYVIGDMFHEQYGPDERDAAIRVIASQDGGATKISLPQDPGQAGKTQVLYLTRMLAGYRVVSSPESGDKVTRAEPFAAQVNIGNVLMLRGPWNRGVLNELRMFPNGANDDQVDALSRAFAELINKSVMRISQETLNKAAR